MLTFHKGDMFEGLQPGDAVAHGCNCQGVMGAGVAKIVSNRWPTMYQEYRRLCQDGILIPGTVYPYVGEDGVLVFNLMTQEFPGADAKLEYIDRSVSAMMIMAWRSGNYKAIRTPMIGCGIGGLRAEDVIPILEERAGKPIFGMDIDLQLYTL